MKTVLSRDAAWPYKVKITKAKELDPLREAKEQLIDQKEKRMKAVERARNDTLEEVALEFEKMRVMGDTATSFAAFVRGMKK
jgi:hypothetical protein